jgi:hypothetical protein
MGLAAASTATTAGGRAEAAVVLLPAAGRVTSRKGYEALEIAARALGAADFLVAAHQLLELGTAAATAIVVDGHERSLAGAPVGVKWKGRPAVR